jgi:polysaccharide export outer membrane protein
LLSTVGATLLWSGAPAAATAQNDQAPTTADQATAANPRGVGPDARYQLKRGDVVELHFPFVTDFNQTITIPPDGFVTLRVVGSVRADGLTAPELTQVVRDAYAPILRDPIVTIELKEFEKPYFIVTGEVERPGKYDLRGEVTATQAIAVAGGLKERARHSKATIFRRLPEGRVEARTIDLKKMLKEAHLAADVRLESGDMVFIPRGQRIKITDITSSLWVLAWLP